jgi:hypothetical protein
MLLLLSALQVFPAIVDVLRAFGQRTAAKDESYGAFYAQENPDESCKGKSNLISRSEKNRCQRRADFTECAYTIKYSEKHGRDEPLDPWSLRQMGIYHQRLGNNDSNVFIVLNPSRPFLKRIKKVVSCKSRVTPESVQMMALSAAMDNWRWYISDLEERYTTAVKCMNLGKILSTLTTCRKPILSFHLSRPTSPVTAMRTLPSKTLRTYKSCKINYHEAYII